MTVDAAGQAAARILQLLREGQAGAQAMRAELGRLVELAATDAGAEAGRAANWLRTFWSSPIPGVSACAQEAVAGALATADAAEAGLRAQHEQAARELEAARLEVERAALALAIIEARQDPLWARLEEVNGLRAQLRSLEAEARERTAALRAQLAGGPPARP